MKSLKLITGMTALLLIMSFGKEPVSSQLSMSGKYGVCSYENNIPAYLELTLNEDNTFHYIDKTNAAKPIDTKGNWTMGKNTIMLSNYQSGFAIHNKWKVDKNTKCLKSKRGMTFYRLCNIASCNQE